MPKTKRKNDPHQITVRRVDLQNLIHIAYGAINEPLALFHMDPLSPAQIRAIFRAIENCGEAIDAAKE